MIQLATACAPASSLLAGGLAAVKVGASLTAVTVMVKSRVAVPVGPPRLSVAVRRTVAVPLVLGAGV